MIHVLESRYPCTSRFLSDFSDSGSPHGIVRLALSPVRHGRTRPPRWITLTGMMWFAGHFNYAVRVHTTRFGHLPQYYWFSTFY
jgi:hypothetical protein